MRAVAILLTVAGAAWAQSEVAEIERRLSTQLLPWVEFSDATIEEVADFFSEATGLNIVVHQDALGAEPVTFHARQVTPRSVLNLLLRYRDLMYVIRDGVVEIVPETHEPAILRAYDIREITYALPDFPGQEIDLLSSDTFGPPPPSDDAEPVIDPALIEDLITSHTGGDSWDEHPDASISVLDNGVLLVRQTRATHRQIERFLAMLR